MIPIPTALWVRPETTVNERATTMSLRRYLMAVLLFTMSTVARADILWLRLDARYTYKDPSVSCSTLNPGVDFFFSAEVENDQIQRAFVHNFPNVWPYMDIYKNTAFLPEELKKISLYTDSKGRLWLKKVTLSERLLKWILYYPTRRDMFCELPEQISIIVPDSASYEFETEGIEEGVLISYSQRLPFKGKTASSHAFETKVQLVQRDFKSWHGTLSVPNW